MYARLSLLALAACGRVSFDAIPGDGLDAAPDAVPIETSLCGNFVAARAPQFTNASPVFEVVPGSEVDVHVAQGEAWMVWVSAGLSSSDVGQMNVEARLVVDGAARSTNQIQNEVANHPLPWFMFDVLFAGDHHVAVELRDLVATARIENLHVVAFRAPVLQWQELAQPVQVMTTNLDVMPITVSIPATADYLVFAAASISESPSNSDVIVGLREPGGAHWPEGEFSSNRQTWLPAVWARRVTLAAGNAPFAIYGRSNNVATIRDSRFAIIPADAVGSQYAQRVASTGATMAGEDTAVMFSALAPAKPIDRVTIQAITVDGGGDATMMNPVISELRRNGETKARYENWSSGTPIVPSGFVDAFVAREPMTLANTLIVVDPVRNDRSREAVIHTLDLPCP